MARESESMVRALDTSSKEPTPPEASADTDSNQTGEATSRSITTAPNAIVEIMGSATEELNAENSHESDAAQEQEHEPLASVVSLSETDDQGTRQAQIVKVSGIHHNKLSARKETFMSATAQSYLIPLVYFGIGIRRFYRDMTNKFARDMMKMSQNEGEALGQSALMHPGYYEIEALKQQFEEFVKAEIARGAGFKFDGVKMVD